MSEPKPYSAIALFYDLLDLPFEYFRYRPVRKHLWRGLKGHILDAGVGTGRNMPFYPDPANMVAIDLSPAMLEHAERRADRQGIAVELLEKNICNTGFEAQTFDAVVSSFLFCVLDDQAQLPALQELARICRDDGEIRILEYAYAKNPFHRAIMSLWAPWVAFAYGARFDRNTQQYVQAAGLELIEDRFVHGDIIRLLVMRPVKRPLS